MISTMPSSHNHYRVLNMTPMCHTLCCFTMQAIDLHKILPPCSLPQNLSTEDGHSLHKLTVKPENKLVKDGNFKPLPILKSKGEYK